MIITAHLCYKIILLLWVLFTCKEYKGLYGKIPHTVILLSLFAVNNTDGPRIEK